MGRTPQVCRCLSALCEGIGAGIAAVGSCPWGSGRLLAAGCIAVVGTVPTRRPRHAGSTRRLDTPDCLHCQPSPLHDTAHGHPLLLLVLAPCQLLQYHVTYHITNNAAAVHSNPATSHCTLPAGSLRRRCAGFQSVRQSGSDRRALDFYCSVPSCLQLAVSSGCQRARIHTFYTHIGVGRYATVSEAGVGDTQPPVTYAHLVPFRTPHICDYAMSGVQQSP